MQHTGTFPDKGLGRARSFNFAAQRASHALQVMCVHGAGTDRLLMRPARLGCWVRLRGRGGSSLATAGPIQVLWKGKQLVPRLWN